METSWSVRVPASTSNLGPGFDLLGLALGLFLDVRVHPSAERVLLRSGEGERELPEAGEDLVLMAFERVRARVPFTGEFRFEVRSEIPVGRGLGSSGAAIVAGLLLAQAVSRHGFVDEELLALGVELEGHPDNVAAALRGGMTLCARASAGRWTTLAPPLAPSIGFAVAWPREPLETSRARAALPGAVPFADAVENPRRLAFLLEGLRRGDPALITWGGEERLHVRHRLPLLPGAERALAAGRDAGAWLTTLSGAGSGVLALGAHGAMEPVAQAMAAELEAATGAGTGRVLAPVHGRPVVESLTTSLDLE
jgi:homoserine kinase